MKQSMRAKRMARHHQRNKAKSKLSLVSLMDIFTILVFFLMLNASDVQVLQTSDKLALPMSTAKQAAKETLVMLVTPDQVLIQGKAIATTADLAKADQQAIDAVKDELAYHATRQRQIVTSVTADDPNTSGNTDREGQAITIMGDSKVTYAVLKQVMQVCANQGFTNLALAVENKSDTGSALSSGGMQ